MTDIFLSYSREDQQVARRFAEAFAARGLEVWWDTTLRAGEAYDEVTEAALRSAKAVVVLWSARSVASRWVRAEATVALRNKTLVPCMIAPCERPIMFELTQTADLELWTGASDDPRWLAFLADVMGHIARGRTGGLASGSSRAPVPPPAPPAPLPVSAAPVRPAQSERRHLTFLACRLEETGSGAAARDPEDWQAIVQMVEPRVTEALAAFGGTASWHSSEVAAIFGYPVAHEDAAERAIRAGLAVIAALGGLQDPLAAEHDAVVAARIGIHAGTALIGPGRDGATEVFGDGPAIAVRARGAAAAGAVVFTGDVAELVTGIFDTETLASLPPVDGGVALPLFRAVEPRPEGRQPVAARAGRRFIGREDELALLMSRWRRAADGDGQHLLVKGEPGIGKSRLLEEFREWLAGQPHRWIGWSGASLFANTPFHAVVQMLRQMLETRGGDPTEALRRELAEADMPADAFDLVATMLGLPLPAGHAVPELAPVQRRRRLIETLTEWVFTLTRHQPVVVAIEDLHWIDPSTMELVQILVDQGGTMPLMVVGTARPEFRKAWLDRDHHGQINLGRLDSRQTYALVADAIGTADVDDAIIQKLVARTDGVPFFVEELARRIVVHGSDRAAGDIPTTLRGLLAARLDRLGAARETAQLGAILGRSFTYEMIRAFAGIDDSRLEIHLGQMATEELVQQRGVPPRASYTFKHALTHEAAYELLPKSRRTKEHRRMAEMMPVHFADDAEAHPEIVAWHFSNGGNAEQAARYWLLAGQLALRRNAHLEAIAHLHDALKAVGALPETPQLDVMELDIQIALGTATMVAKGQASPESETVWRRALDLSGTLGDIARQGQALFGLWLFETVRADHQASLAHSNAILDLARLSGNEELLMTGTLSKVSSNFFLGNIDDVINDSNAILAAYDLGRHAGYRFHIGMDPAAMARAYRAQAWWLKGDFAAAAAGSADALAFARQLNHLYSLANVIAYSAWQQQYLHAEAALEVLAAELTALCSKEKVPLFLGNGVMLTGWLRCQRGEDDGPAVYARGLEIYCATGSRCFLPYRWALLADALSARGDHAGAARLFADAIAAIERTSERWAEPEVHRLHGESLVRAGAGSAAIAACFERAVATARDLGLGGWERAALRSRDAFREHSANSVQA